MFWRYIHINGLPDNYIMEILKTWFSPKKEKIYIGFEDLKYAITSFCMEDAPSNRSNPFNMPSSGGERNENWYKQREQYVIINTLSTYEQDCLIIGTCSTTTEENIINKMIETSVSANIILYGRNSSDESVRTKRTQLQRLGFETVYIYGGGLFEWLLLQDIYGFNEFPTTTKCKDMLRFRPVLSISQEALHRITY